MSLRATAIVLSATALLLAGGCRGRRADAGQARQAPSSDDAPAPYRFHDVELPATPAAAPGRRPNLVLMVLDTVRAQSLHLCGYERPTTPFLDGFTSRPGVSHTCHAYSPGTWTIPSHTSYFTGLPVNEHGYDSVSHGFDADIPVLAEALAADGYTTVMVSANPTLSRASGLDRGFQHVLVARSLRELRGDDLAKAVRKLLKAEVSPDAPLFLFVNILDAHDPYPRVPEQAGWVPAQDQVDFPVFDRGQDSEYHHYVRGEMSPADAAAYEARVRNGYDWGVAMADRTASYVLEVLKRDHWLDHGFRLVITSDHGEYLGEHGLLRHGCYTWEPVVRVPFVYVDSARTEPLPLPEPFPAVQAYWLLRDGALRSEVVTASFSESRRGDVKVGADMVALWTSNAQKLVAYPPGQYQFDLTTDPQELGRVQLGEHPLRETLTRLTAEHHANLAKERSRKLDASRVMELQALGYTQ